MKQFLPIFFFLLPCFALAQYPSNGNQKITLGEQTTADGLIYRGVASIDTLTATNKITRANKQDTSAFILLDTVTNLLWHYKTASNGWSQAGGSTFDTTSIKYVNTYGTQTVNGAKTFTNSATFNSTFTGNPSSGSSDVFKFKTTGNTGNGVLYSYSDGTGVANGIGSNLSVSSGGSLTRPNTALGAWAIDMDNRTNPSIQFYYINPSGTFSIPFKIDSSSNVGINTGTPTEKLHVVGNGLFTNKVSVGGSTGVSLLANPAANGYGGFWHNSVVPAATNYAMQTNGETVLINGSTAVTIAHGGSGKLSIRSFGADVVGDFGIGITPPTSRLHVKGVTNTSGESSLNVTNSSDASLLFVRNDGNVGIGTSNPISTLELNKTTGNLRFSVNKGANKVVNFGSGTEGTGSFGILQIYNTDQVTPDIQFFAGGDSHIMGNVGIGVTPSAWSSGTKALQVGTYGALAWLGGVDISMTNNAYYNGTNWVYIASQEAALFLNNRNTFAWYQTSAGTAGTAITFTQAMTLGTNSGLSIGTASSAPANGLLVAGAATFSSSVTAGGKFEASFSNTNTTFDNSAYLRLVNTGTSTLNQRVDLIMRFEDGDYNGTGGISMVRESATARSSKLVLQPIASNGNNVEALTILGNGNVGIGTTSPNSKLQISDFTSGLPPTSGTATRGGFRIVNSSNITFDFGTVAAGQAWLQVSDVNNYASNFSLLLNPNGGNVGIGTTNPTTKLSIDGNLNLTSQSNYVLFGTDLNVNPYFQGTSTDQFALGTRNLSRILIENNGDIQIRSLKAEGSRAVLADAEGVLSAPVSSINYKENVQTLNYGLTELLQINPVSFDYINKDKWGEERNLGFIVEDMFPVIPEVTGTMDNGDMYLDMTKLIPVLTKAIQEQNALIKALQQRLLILENK